MSDWVKISGWSTPDARPREVIRAAGLAVILASAAAALLPAGNFANGPQIVGGLMITVGLLEVMANLFRAADRSGALVAGAVSIGSGFLLMVDPASNFLTTVYIFIGWLMMRGLLLSISAVEVSGATARAAMAAAAVDFALAAMTWAGLTASTLVIALFGPTKPMIANFAWLVAASFVAAGMLLLKVASEERPG